MPLPSDTVMLFESGATQQMLDYMTPIMQRVSSHRLNVLS